MNKDFDELKEKIEQAKDLVKTLEDKYNELQNKPKNVRWRAESNHDYFYIGNYDYFLSSIYKACEKHSDIDNERYALGNYFKTRKEAEKYKQHLIMTQKLKDIALRLNDGEKVDWCDFSSLKWFIYYDGEIRDNCTHIAKAANIYCLSNKFLETAIKEIGEQELIEYIKEC